jgi:hypothetical protein
MNRSHLPETQAIRTGFKIKNGTALINFIQGCAVPLEPTNPYFCMMEYFPAHLTLKSSPTIKLIHSTPVKLSTQEPKKSWRLEEVK